MDPATANAHAWHEEARTRLWRYLRYLGCPADLAADFTQDALLAALREFPGAAAPTPWLLTTARNRFRMHLRTARREVPDLDLLHAQWVLVAGSDDGDTPLRALRRCLAELPERSRRALELRYGSGAERPEIGRELGLGDEGVKSLLVRVRAVLAACMQKRITEES
jgi:RNA polymerase sigma-70 factor, ECF subfamily